MVQWRYSYARLKRKKKTSTRLELDSFYLPIPIHENKLSPPTGIHMALLVDRDSGVVLDQSTGGPDVPALTAAPSMFVNYMEECGRPSAVYVRSEWMGTLLRNTCKAVGVRLVESEGVPMLDNCLDGLIGTLLMGVLPDRLWRKHYSCHRCHVPMGYGLSGRVGCAASMLRRIILIAAAAYSQSTY